MSTCPICQAPITPKMRNCDYCGVSLIDRKHKAPSQAPPALLSRPVSHQDPLGLEVSTTPAAELSTMNLTMDSVNESGDPFTVDLSGSESDALVIETPVPALIVPEQTSSAPRITSENQAVYVPTTVKGEESPKQTNSFIEPRLATIDEASDGLGPLDIDLDQHDLVFPNEPVMGGASRPQAKLSDLSGRHLLSEIDQITPEPSFDIQSSALSQAISSSAHQSAKLTSTTGNTSTLSPTSSLSFLGQGLLFTGITLGVLWLLGFGDTLLALPTWLNQGQSISSQVDLNVTQGFKSLPTPIDTIKLSDDPITDQNMTNEFSMDLTDNKVPNNELLNNANKISAASKSSDLTDKVRVNPASYSSFKKSAKINSNKAKNKSTPKKRNISYNSLIRQGEKLLMRGRVKQAESLFKKAQRLNPSKAEALAQLAWCQLARKKTRSAITKFKQALSKNPVHGDSLYGLGYSYEKLNESKQAIHYFELYLKRYPKGKKVGVIKNKMRRLQR